MAAVTITCPLHACHDNLVSGSILSWLRWTVYLPCHKGFFLNQSLQNQSLPKQHLKTMLWRSGQDPKPPSSRGPEKANNLNFSLPKKPLPLQRKKVPHFVGLSGENPFLKTKDLPEKEAKVYVNNVCFKAWPEAAYNYTLSTLYVDLSLVLNLSICPTRQSFPLQTSASRSNLTFGTPRRMLVFAPSNEIENEPEKAVIAVNPIFTRRTRNWKEVQSLA